MTNEILLGDTFELIKTVKNNSVDCIIFDPLFDLEIEKYQNLVTEINRVLKDSGCVYCFMNWKRICEVKSILDKQLQIINWIIWARSSSGKSGKNYKTTREEILWYSKTKNYKFNRQVRILTDGDVPPYFNTDGTPRGWFYDEVSGKRKRYAEIGNVWHYVDDENPEILYDTRPFWSSKEFINGIGMAKPLTLIERLILTSTDENDTVLDLFSGSGVVSEVCHKLNRNSVAFEIDEQRVQIAKERIEKWVKL
jgi:site-specific DNA-methyltransferase (adenine-specific)